MSEHTQDFRGFALIGDDAEIAAAEARRKAEDDAVPYAKPGDGTPHSKLSAGETVSLPAGTGIALLRVMYGGAVDVPNAAGTGMTRTIGQPPDGSTVYIDCIINGVRAITPVQYPFEIHGECVSDDGTQEFRFITNPDELAERKVAREREAARQREREEATTRYLVTVRPSADGPVTEVSRIRLWGINEFGSYETRVHECGDSAGELVVETEADITARISDAVGKARACWEAQRNG